MNKPVPVLGPEGWVVSAQKKADYLLAHLYASDYSQSFLFNGSVSSMAKLVKENQGKLGKAISEIRGMLVEYFNLYFDTVEVDVYEYQTNDFHRGELVMSALLTDSSGETVQIHEVFTKEGSVVRNFLDYQLEERS